MVVQPEVKQKFSIIVNGTEIDAKQRDDSSPKYEFIIVIMNNNNNDP